MDLAEWWQQRRWRALLELIEQLPLTSRYQQALTLDKESAAALLAAERRGDAPAGSGEWAPPLTDWDTQTTLLAEIRDMLPDLVQAVLSSIPRQKGRPAPKYTRPPFPRPRTAIDDVRLEQTTRAGHVLVALFFDQEGGE